MKPTVDVIGVERLIVCFVDDFTKNSLAEGSINFKCFANLRDQLFEHIC